MTRRGPKWRPAPLDAPLGALKAAIRAQLEADGATQADLAQHLGISEKHCSQILTGKIVGSWPMLERMAEAVGVSVSFGRDAP